VLAVRPVRESPAPRSPFADPPFGRRRPVRSYRRSLVRWRFLTAPAGRRSIAGGLRFAQTSLFAPAQARPAHGSLRSPFARSPAPPSAQARPALPYTAHTTALAYSSAAVADSTTTCSSTNVQSWSSRPAARPSRIRIPPIRGHRRRPRRRSPSRLAAGPADARRDGLSWGGDGRRLDDVEFVADGAEIRGGPDHLDVGTGGDDRRQRHQVVVVDAGLGQGRVEGRQSVGPSAAPQTTLMRVIIGSGRPAG